MTDPQTHRPDENLPDDSPEISSQQDADGDEPTDPNADDGLNPDDEIEELSLDDLGAAYARAAAAHDPESFAAPPEPEPQPEQQDDETDAPVEPDAESELGVTPEGVVEAALFVGHPENKPFTAARLASLMRDVTENDVRQIIEQLNESYREADQAFRIVDDDGGFRLTIAPAVETVRQSFLGKVREARLSHLAIEVFALVAYQPGISAQTVQDQRGRDCGSLLNQLVRRRLLEVKREKPADGGRKIPHYYPTERFLVLFGLESLDDLPLVDETAWQG